MLVCQDVPVNPKTAPLFAAAALGRLAARIAGDDWPSA
jgi:hypothetical protein